MCNFTSNCSGKLTFHKNTIHWKRFLCDDCDYEGISTKDRNKDIQTSHKTIGPVTWRMRFKISAHDIEFEDDFGNYYDVEEYLRRSPYEEDEEHFYDIEEHVKRSVENINWFCDMGVWNRKCSECIIPLDQWPEFCTLSDLID